MNPTAGSNKKHKNGSDANTASMPLPVDAELPHDLQPENAPAPEAAPEAVRVTGEVPPEVPPETASAIETKPEDSAEGDKPEGGDGAEGGEGAKQANRSKLYVVFGEVHEFASRAQAEKFLNEREELTPFTVFRGHKIEAKPRVSLRG